MGRKAVNKVPAFVDALVEVGVRRLAKLPACQPDEARRAMHDIAGSICDIYGKTQMYVPANVEAERQKRDAEIRTQYASDGESGAGKFTADRLKEIARTHGLTIAHAYEIVRVRGAGTPPPPAAPAVPAPAALCTADAEA
jgi:hypothetical protein